MNQNSNDFYLRQRNEYESAIEEIEKGRFGFNSKDNHSLRLKYESLLEEMKKNRQSFIENDFKKLDDLLKAVNENFENVRDPSLVALDSKCFAVAAEISVEKIKSISDISKKFSKLEFSKLLSFFISKNDCLPNDALKFWDGICINQGITNQYKNTGENDSRPIKTRERRIVESKSVSVKTDNVGKDFPKMASEFPVSQDETSNRIVILYKKIQKSPGQKLHSIVLDPESFSRTVENIFHLSFLVNDGRVKLYGSGDFFNLYVSICDIKDCKNLTKNHYILNFSLNDWKIWKTKLLQTS